MGFHVNFSCFNVICVKTLRICLHMYMIPATVMILFLMIMIETWNQSFYGLENSYMKIFTNRSVFSM